MGLENISTPDSDSSSVQEKIDSNSVNKSFVELVDTTEFAPRDRLVGWAKNKLGHNAFQEKTFAHQI